MSDEVITRMLSHYIWEIFVVAMIPGLAILSGISPVAIYHRVKMLHHKNFMYTKEDQLSLILFDIGIFLFAVFFLIISVSYSVKGFQGGSHNWPTLIIILAIIYCFTAGLIMRRGIMKRSGDLTLTTAEERDYNQYKHDTETPA